MGELRNNGVKSCVALLEQYRRSGDKPFQAEKLTFAGIGGKDVYNITAPFQDNGETVVAGRVESRDSEQSEIVFFVRSPSGEWVPKSGAPVLSLQDPFHTRINGELILGGVETFPHPEREGLGWRTVFYRGADLGGLRRFFDGPDYMKDLRLVQLKDGRIGVFTRPQGVKGGRGKIGYTTAAALEDLTHELVAEAPLLEGLFLDEEWGGCNEIHVLSNGLLGVLGHIARFDEQRNRHYYPMVFVFDPENREFTDMRIIAERSDFADGPAKRPDLVDVVFSGGLIRKADGTADLYAGVSDAEAHKITISDPFLQYER